MASLVRCSNTGFDVLVVFLKPFPPRTYPKVKIATGGATVHLEATVIPPGAAISLGSVQNLSHFRLAERHPALAHAVMAPLICWSFSNSMFRYLLVDHAVPAMWRSLAAARLSAD